MSTTILHHISTLFTSSTQKGPLTGDSMKTGTLLHNAWVVIKDGILQDLGEGEDYLPYAKACPEATLFSGEGCTATPGLVDAHTHLVHGGSRENEFGMKLSGVPYLQILKEGGGILSTVRSTRAASLEQLVSKAKKSMDLMLAHGTTTAEAKSGYGLSWEEEKKQMQAVQRLHASHPMDLVSTFMGAHAIPEEYKTDAHEYIRLLIEEMIPQTAKEGLAEFCDVFCEEGVFSVADTRRILLAARQSGLKLKLHADEIISIGGAELAAELGSVTADHLMAASPKGIHDMAKSKVIANLLPGTTFSLMKNQYANARLMIESGVAVALSSDYNPGSCPCENLQLVMQLACLQMKMTPIEVFNAVTVNGAYALSREKTAGSLEIGKPADIVLFHAPNLEYILYHFGINHVKDVYKNGRLVVQDGHLVKA